MNQTMTLTCPKCRGAMTSYERNGVVIDQCSECRGIFLDRGELERLLDLSSGAVDATAAPQFPGEQPDRSWRPQPPVQQPPVAWPSKQSRHDWDDDSDSHRGRGHAPSGSHGAHYPPKKKKSKAKSMLGEFLDFG